jgi:hypothetical protein
MYAWGLLAFPARALLGYYLDWLLEHPTRLLVAYAIWAVLSMVYPPVPHPW